MPLSRFTMVASAYTPTSGAWALLAPHPLPHSVPLVCLILALAGVWRHPVVVLICISLMTDIGECLFVRFLGHLGEELFMLFFWVDSPPNRLTESLTVPLKRQS